ncbi:uncharacterized protein AMSG_12140 [Thecamonas trahens ATCC 50062]|uniref:non-specific serine/threonine protein kinase n=1 Tax=Thecamonas trahens ATCC 50062 TaxID=461836 RepID=A0A0L0DKQ0_THETB|nr:hypothetical protein AMSG_12140 [Thecamonas trahens ATCC 50062]KNC51933.1 hypothetical protein AMSG_12140 [Thecamonas trahens ATCC 50062]|eukprot:XP_013755625.1 hypothetical protein AMSG_12140 [Thecamonas trahens ATCC 50062]
MSIADVVDAGDPRDLYEIIEKVGRGSYGSVFKGMSKATGAVVAIKTLALEEGEDLEDVINEIRILKQCDHPNIVKYFGSYMVDDDLWIVMEFCDGGSVLDIYEALDSPLAEAQIAYIVRESFKGLLYLHENGMIHRDIKGGNVLLTSDGRVLLADFGVSAILNTTLSKRNTFIGTPYWIAPEVIMVESDGDPYDAKADIWSMGITAIEMAELGPPYGDVHPMRALFLIGSAQRVPSLHDKKAWSSAFHAFLEACLVKDPAGRPSAVEILEHEFLKNAPTSAAILTELIEQAREAEANASVGLGRAAGTMMRMKAGEAPKSDTTSDEDDSGTFIKKKMPEAAAPAAAVPDVAVQGSDSDSDEDSDADGASAATKAKASKGKSPAGKNKPLAKNVDSLKVGVATHGRADSTVSSTLRPASTTPLHQVSVPEGYAHTFEAQALLRDFTRGANCADNWGEKLFIGTSKGIYLFDPHAASPELTLVRVVKVKCVELIVIEELSVVVTISGSSSQVVVYELRSLAGAGKKKKKTKAGAVLASTKNCHSIFIGRDGEDNSNFFLCAAIKKKLYLCEWAPHPYNKFMHLVEFSTSSRTQVGLLFKDPTTNILSKIICGSVSNKTELNIIDIASYKTSELASFKGKAPPAAVLHLDGYTVLFSFKTSAKAIDIRTGATVFEFEWAAPVVDVVYNGSNYIVGFTDKSVEFVSLDNHNVCQTLSHASPLKYLCQSDFIYIASMKKKTTGVFKIQAKRQRSPVDRLRERKQAAA